jgi:hypothetical protein
VHGGQAVALPQDADGQHPFASHPERLGYALRLRQGQALLGGKVEGSIKQVVNKRLKQTGCAGRLNKWGRWSNWVL